MSEQTASGRLNAARVARPEGRTLIRPDRGTPGGAFALARVAVDLASLGCAAVISSSWDHGTLPAAATAAAVVVIMAVYAGIGLYVPQRQPRPAYELSRMLTISGAVVMLLTVIELAVGHDGVGDAAARFWLLSVTMTAAARVSVHGVEHFVRRSLAEPPRATLIVGAGRVGHLAARRLLDDPSLGMQPIGFLDKEPLQAEDASLSPRVMLPVLGASWDLERVVAEHGVTQVLVAFSTAPSNVVLDVVRRCWDLGVSVMVVPRLYEVEGRRARVEHLGALPVISLRPSDPQGPAMAIKYALDRIVAGLTLLVLSPLLALIALAILLTSGRPLFFGQQRVGRDGHVFRMLKFRTMSGSPESSGEYDAEWAAAVLGIEPKPREALPDRRTPVGAILRRTSLDELPQLWNVFCGDMSLVGPRPERLHYVERFEDSIYRYPDRHRVRSGLTGWAQVNGLRGDTSLSDRVEWDNFYIENWSPWLDLKILVKTIPALLGGRGAR